MGVLVTLGNQALAVEPGGSVTCPVHVRNTGSIVDEFSIAVVGDAEPWAVAEPPSVNVFPGGEADAVIRFSPPRSSSVRAGDVPFGIRVTSREDPSATAVEEGTLTVAPFADVFAELLPRTSRGRRHARHQLAIDNRSNTLLVADLAAADPTGTLGFRLQPASVEVAPGIAAFTDVFVTPAARFWRGPSRTHPFQVQLVRPDAPAVVADGSMMQDAALPGWLIPVLEGLLALAVIAAVLWFTVLKPAIKSEAKKAAVTAVAAKTGGGGAGGSKGGGGGGGGGSPSVSVSPLTTLATLPPSPTTTTPGSPPVTASPAAALGVPIDGRLSATKPGIVAFQVPAGKILNLTDVVFENPGADTGPLTLQRDGTPLLVMALENFRDLDEHFATPVVFPAGSQLQLNAGCSSPDCTPGAYFTGRLLNAGP